MLDNDQSERESDMRTATLLMTTLAVATLGWTTTGESSDPVLGLNEMPAEVLQGCGKIQVDTASDTCVSADDYKSRWIGRTGRGQLFLVMAQSCAERDCHAWFVEKTARGANTLLAVEGGFQLTPAAGAYPMVETRRELSPQQLSVSRYEWNGSGYVRAETRIIYRVDGRECGTADECRETAEHALRGQRIDEAVRIWQNVHGVAWI